MESTNVQSVDNKAANIANIVDGFLLYTEKDAALAAQEQKKIEYLEAKMDYRNPKNILTVYTKIIKERIFKTPVGMTYLKQLQAFLMKQPGIKKEDILPIPLYVTFDTEIREQTNPAKKRIVPSKKKQKKSMALPISIILNIGLCIAVIAMFVIALNSSQPNILNYEKNLVNHYSTWEQELTEREQVVREKELELKLQ